MKFSTDVSNAYKKAKKEADSESNIAQKDVKMYGAEYRKKKQVKRM